MNVTETDLMKTMDHAILHKNVHKIQDCINQGVDVNASIHHGEGSDGKPQYWSFLYHAFIGSYNPRSEIVIRLLMDNGAVIPKNEVKNYLSWIVRKKNTSLLTYCLNKTGPFTYPEGTNEGLLEQALRVNNVAAAKELIKFGDNVNFHPQTSKSSPLHAATRYSQVTLSNLKLLIDHGADVNHRDSDKDTALHFAINNDRPGVVKFLLKHQANPDYYNKKHNAPINLLFRQNHFFTGNLPLKNKHEMARSLLEAGCNQNAVGKSYKTPLYCAVLDRDTRMVELLIEFSTELEKYNYDRARLKAEKSLDKVLKKVEAYESDNIPKYLNAEKEKLQTIVQTFQTIARTKSGRF